MKVASVWVVLVWTSTVVGQGPGPDNSPIEDVWEEAVTEVSQAFGLRSTTAPTTAPGSSPYWPIVVDVFRSFLGGAAGSLVVPWVFNALWSSGPALSYVDRRFGGALRQLDPLPLDGNANDDDNDVPTRRDLPLPSPVLGCGRIAAAGAEFGSPQLRGLGQLELTGLQMDDFWFRDESSVAAATATPGVFGGQTEFAITARATADRIGIVQKGYVDADLVRCGGGFFGGSDDNTDNTDNDNNDNNETSAPLFPTTTVRQNFTATTQLVDCALVLDSRVSASLSPRGSLFVTVHSWEVDTVTFVYDNVRTDFDVEEKDGLSVGNLIPFHLLEERLSLLLHQAFVQFAQDEREVPDDDTNDDDDMVHDYAYQYTLGDDALDKIQAQINRALDLPLSE